MYTLEEHLETCSSQSGQFELLNSIWKLNKKFIPDAQSAISFNFPHYSLHERSHSETIIKNIERFLGADRIKQLSPTDTWLILMASFTHDLGMVVFHNVLEHKWMEDDFQGYLEKTSQSDFDKDLKDAAKLVLKIQNINNTQIKGAINLPLEIRKAVILITADFYRRVHHLRSKEMIRGADEEFNKIVNGFHLNGIPNRFAIILSEIAYAHGIDFYSVFERLEYQADGLGNDKMHPRFIAFLLRLGDLLDVDDKRFNLFNAKVLSGNLPSISQSHLEKHASIKHLLISSQSIEVTVDCKTDSVYRVAREWFDWLQIEVQNQSREWSGIAPKNMIGMPPTISRGKIKILYQSAEAKEGLMNLRFSISSRKVFEMFEGSAIYEEAECVFLRELVQNAIDASKIQLWKSIQSGLYDFSLRKHFKQRNEFQEALIKAIKFPTDIPGEIWLNFPINLKIDWADDSSSVLRFIVEDNGTGISEEELIRMTQKVGESRNSDENYLKMKESMPYWLKPTGAFGIGLQSIFLATNNFTVQTKSEAEAAKEIIFFSAKNGEYSRVTSNVPLMTRGTRIIIDIPRESFSEVFSNKFNTEIIENFDPFTDKYGDVYIHKIESYILKEFQHVDLLSVTLMGNEIKSSIIKNPEAINDFSNWKFRKEQNLSVYLKNDPYKSKMFMVFENLGVGSTFFMEFYSDFDRERVQNMYRYQSSKYLVRDIPVDERFPRFYKTSYLNVIWNFESPESDKILNVSRDKFINRTKYKFHEVFLDTLLPKTLKHILNLFEEDCKTNSLTEQLAIEYFHIELTCIMSNVKTSHLKEIYRDHLLPLELTSKPNLEPIMFDEFFNAARILLFNKIYFNRQAVQSENLKNEFLQLNETEKFKGNILIWDKGYFESYLRLSEYRLESNLAFLHGNGLCIIKTLIKNDGSPDVICNTLSRKLIIDELKDLSIYSKRRKLIEPIVPYAETLAVNKNIDDFRFEVPNVSHYIISPFKDKSEYVKLVEGLQDDINNKREHEIKEHIKEAIDELIPGKLIDFILKNSASANKDKITKEMIKESYVKLISEVILLSFDESDELMKYKAK